jgi:hypothetical protein
MVTSGIQKSRFVRVGFMGLLLLILVGLLGAYGLVGTRVPTWVPTSAYPVFEADARLSSIAQLAPILNYLSAEGFIEAGEMSWRSSRVRANLTVQSGDDAENGGLLYDLVFHGEYQLILPDSDLNTVEVIFPFPRNLQTLHDVQFLVDGEEPDEVEFSTGAVRWQDEFFSREEHTITIRYQAEGAQTFSYVLPKEQRTDVDVQVTIVGLAGSTVSETSLPPANIESTDESETVIWEYTNLIDNRNIEISLPVKPTFSQRLSQVQSQLHDFTASAPIVVGSALLALAVLFHMSGTRLKLESYLLIGCSLAFFFPMVHFSSALIDLLAGSIISLVITIGVIALFLRQTAGWDQTGRSTVVVLSIFLGVFALGLITEWRGLLFTSGGVVLLGLFMVRYARGQRTRETLEPAPFTNDEMYAAPVQLLDEDLEAVSATPSAHYPEQRQFHCPRCAHGLGHDANFCPECGYETKQIRICDSCGHEQLPPLGLTPSYCLSCGEVMD